MIIRRCDSCKRKLPISRRRAIYLRNYKPNIYKTPGFRATQGYNFRIIDLCFSCYHKVEEICNIKSEVINQKQVMEDRKVHI